MNKTELIAAMAEASGLSKKDCEAALAAFITTTESALKAGNKVQLVGFGSFEIKERAARTGKNPATGEQMVISQILCKRRFRCKIEQNIFKAGAAQAAAALSTK